MQLSLCYDAMLGFVVADVISVRNIPKGSLGRYPGKQFAVLLVYLPNYLGQETAK